MILIHQEEDGLTDLSDKGRLTVSMNMRKQHQMNRENLRIQTQKKAFKKRKNQFYEKLMDSISEDIILKPIRNFFELSDQDRSNVLTDITQFLHCEPFQRKILNLQYQKLIVSILANAKDLQTKSIFVLELVNLTYYCDQAGSKMIQLGVPGFILTEISQNNFSNTKQQNYLQTLVTLIRNICSSLGCSILAPQLIQSQYFTLVLTKISQFQDSAIRIVTSILHSLVKTMKSILKQEAYHQGVTDMCLKLINLNNPLGSLFNTNDIYDLYEVLLKKTPQQILIPYVNDCNIFVKLGALAPESVKDHHQSQIISFLKVMRTFINALPNESDSLVIFQSQLLFDCVFNGTTNTKLNAISILSEIFPDFQLYCPDNFQLVKQIVKTLEQTLVSCQQFLESNVRMIVSLAKSHSPRTTGFLFNDCQILKILVAHLHNYENISPRITTRILNFMKSQLLDKDFPLIMKNIIQQTKIIPVIEILSQCEFPKVKSSAKQLLFQCSKNL